MGINTKNQLNINRLRDVNNHAFSFFKCSTDERCFLILFEV